jgi:predicted dehydrogenase
MPKSSSQPNRRKFLKKMGGAALATAFGASAHANTLSLPTWNKVSANDTIGLACIGMGIQGFNDVAAALANPGIKFLAAADLYVGRLERAKEVYGKELFTTQDYREILQRDDIDAVIVATTDHTHAQITIDALEAGKHVYCEKPMVQKISEGLKVIEAEKKNPGVLVVGSQGVSSIILEKAREFYQRGDIGKLVLVETFNDRFSAMGAWQYSIPRDASPETIDWPSFLGNAPRVDFDPVRFFRWRNYRDYGTGVAGDLFVHLFSGVHHLLDSKGPNRIFATGGLRYWEDGRDVPDVFIASCDYGKQEGHEAFNMQLRVNFIDGGGGGSRTRLVGTEGTIDLGGGAFTLRRNKLPDAPGYGGWDSYNTFPKKTREEYAAWYEKTYGGTYPPVEGPESLTFNVPDGYSDHAHHFRNWFDAMRTGGKVVEDGSFGFRAAAPSLAANESYFQRQVIEWDPEKMEKVAR